MMTCNEIERNHLKPQNNRIIAFDYLRVIAVFMILYDHIGAFRNPEWEIKRLLDFVVTRPLNIIQDFGALGVSIFFVISGFLLVWNNKSQNAIKKTWDKICQIYISCLLSFVGFFIFQELLWKVLNLDTWWKQYTLRQWLESSTLLGYFNGHGEVINGTTWFLIPLFTFYIIYSIYELLVVYVDDFSLWIVEAFVIIIFAVLRLLHVAVPGIIVYVYIPMFGMILANMLKENHISYKSGVGLLLINYICMSVCFSWYQYDYYANSLYLVSTLYAIGLVLFFYVFRENFRENKFIKYICSISLAVYLLQMTYGSYFMQVLTDWKVPYTVSFIIAVGLIVGISHVHTNLMSIIIKRNTIRNTDEQAKNNEKCNTLKNTTNNAMNGESEKLGEVHSTKLYRDSNVELLRSIMMCMIIAHHYAGHGGLWANEAVKLSVNGYIASCFMVGGKLGVDIFILITGYYMWKQTFNIKRVVKTEVAVLFYSIMFYMIACFGWKIESINFLSMRNAIFSTLVNNGNQSWFIYEYLALICIAPFINKLIDVLTRKQYRNMIRFLLLFECLQWTVLQKNSLYDGQIATFITLYLIGAYLSKYSVEICAAKNYINLVGIFGVYCCWAAVVLWVKVNIEDFVSIGWNEYGLMNEKSIITVVLAVWILLFFKQIKLRNQAWINMLASSTLGIYLIHDNLYVRQYIWANIFKTYKYYTSPYLLGHALACVGSIFLVCAFIEMIRERAFHRLINRLTIKMNILNYFFE